MKTARRLNHSKFFSLTLLCCAFVTAVCFGQGIVSEPAPTSTLTGIALPAQAERITDEKALPQFLGPLNELFGGGKKKPQKPEVIAWDKDKGYSPAAAGTYIRQVEASLEKAGYKTEMRDAGEQSGISVKVISGNKAEQGDGDLVLGIWFVAPDGLILAWGKTLVIPDPPASAMGGKVLADGAPALTDNFVDAFASAVNRIFDVPAVAATKAKVRRNLLAVWQSDDQDSMSNAVRFLIYDEQISQKGADAPLARLLMRAEMLKQAAEPNANSILQQLKQFYAEAHPPIVKGKVGAPALTRDVQQAYVSLMAFALKEMPNGVDELRESEHKWLSDGIVEMYRQADASTQLEMSQLPLVWAAIHNTWATRSEAERSQLRQTFARRLADAAREIKRVRAQDDATDAASAEVRRAADELDRKLAGRTAKPEDFERAAQIAERAFQLFQSSHPTVAKSYSAYAGRLRKQAADLRQAPVAANGGAQDASIQMYANIERQHERNVAQAIAEADRLAKQDPSSGTYNPGSGFWSGIRDLRVSTLNIGANIAGGTYVWR